MKIATRNTYYYVRTSDTEIDDWKLISFYLFETKQETYYANADRIVAYKVEIYISDEEDDCFVDVISQLKGINPLMSR